jgi:hypothetical protein
MRYLCRSLFLAVTVIFLAACGTSSSPDPAAPVLRSLLHSGATIISCNSPAPRCTPPASVMEDLSAPADGERLAVQYQDGHVAVWDVADHAQLLRTPPEPTSHIWLTAGGTVLALDVTSSHSDHDVVVLWAVAHYREKKPESSYLLTTDWVWMNQRGSRILIAPNFNETCPRFPEENCNGVPDLIYYDLAHRRAISTTRAPSVPPANGTAQPPSIATSDIQFDQAGGIFAIASSAQEGFITWRPGSRPIATRAQCDEDGTLTSDGRLFACIRGAADTLSLWNVSQRRMIRQILLPDFASDPQGTDISSVAFADGGRMLAVGEGRKAPKPYVVRVYRVSNFQLIRSFTLRRLADPSAPVRLWAVHQSLVVEQSLYEPADEAYRSSTIFVFSLIG